MAQDQDRYSSIYSATWAKSIAPEGIEAKRKKEEPSFQFKLANALVFNNVKKALGLDECEFYFYGAAPLDPTIRRYFLSLNFYLLNTYGMSESTGPQNLTDMSSLDLFGPIEGFREVGRSLPGTEMIIAKSSPQEEDGKISVIQVRYVIEAETLSWVTTKILKKRPKR